MNKKDFIQALGAGVAFGLIVYCLMMVAVHFIDKNSESIITEPVETILIDHRILPSEKPVPIPVETPDADLAMVTFKYEIRIQNHYDDETLERTNTVEQAIDYILEYSRFHDDLFVYEIKTGELVADSSSINEMRRELASKEQNLIEASEHPEKFTDAQIFELLVD
jgi:hypothetical protein|tara:strand:+ start:290 stop:787 length:498 start_codon:yes stop_codon:yes gene_type:complete